MRVFLTGGTGFVGSHVVEKLLERGDDVVCLVRDQRRAARLFSPERGPRFALGSLHDHKAIRDACRDVDLVIHAAGLTAATTSTAFHRVNAEGTRQLIRAVAEAAPSLSRFIYVSSLAAAGPSAPGRPREEDHPAQPVSAYGRSKLAGENAVREAPFPWTIVRPPAVYGPRDREFLRLFRVIRWHVAPLLAPPGQELSFVYIGDLVEALLSAAARGATQCVYFATHPEVATVRDFVAGIHAAVQRAIGRDGERTLRVVRVPRPITRLVLLGTLSWARLTGRATLLSPDKGQEFLAEAWTCTAARLERDTGWRARVGLSEGLAATASWYRKQGWL